MYKYLLLLALAPINVNGADTNEECVCKVIDGRSVWVVAGRVVGTVSGSFADKLCRQQAKKADETENQKEPVRSRTNSDAIRRRKNSKKTL